MNNGLYEADFYQWCREQAVLLREMRPEGLDWANVAEELEGMARSDKRGLSSQLQRLLMHLLKWRYSVAKRGERSWGKSIINARHQIEVLLEDSFSLRRELESLLLKAYAHAREDAAYQMGINESLFPDQCPWEIAQILDRNFFPERVTQ